MPLSSAHHLAPDACGVAAKEVPCTLQISKEANIINRSSVATWSRETCLKAFLSKSCARPKNTPSSVSTNRPLRWKMIRSRNFDWKDTQCT